MQKLWPGIVRFTDEDDIGEVLEDLGFDGGHRAPDHGHHAARSTLFENFDQAPSLNAHPRQADKVGAAQKLEIDVFDVLVNQRHLVTVWNQSG